ncbi:MULTISPECIES: DUF4279 domain-containing protein [Butyricimonas]|uniref:DUF4279 domain-containing protein n=1 Tax=Butyricimonas TaxID=574697 RepID=UPI00242EE2C3|nr:DUF4279 domain-containing protein [Butyricimonas paravirosa]
MEIDSYYFKISCELAITSEEVSVTDITKQLGVAPDRFFTKGQIFQSKHSGTQGEKTYNLWAISSSESIFEYENITSSLNELRSVLTGREDILRAMKLDVRYDTTLTIWIETDDAGIGLEIQEHDITFFNLVNYVHFTFLPNKIIDRDILG